eukprot:3555242-Prymnesium_polylepis.1
MLAACAIARRENHSHSPARSPGLANCRRVPTCTFPTAPIVFRTQEMPPKKRSAAQKGSNNASKKNDNLKDALVRRPPLPSSSRAPPSLLPRALRDRNPP